MAARAREEIVDAAEVPVTLVRRQKAYLSGAAQTLVAVIKAAAAKSAKGLRATRRPG